MKKLFLLFMVFGLVLAAGLIYADESMPVANDMRSFVKDDSVTYAPLANGITFTEVLRPGIACTSEGGMAGGGMSSEAGKVVPDDLLGYRGRANGISFSESIPGKTCSWAQGLKKELEVHNGITKTE